MAPLKPYFDQSSQRSFALLHPFTDDNEGFKRVHFKLIVRQAWDSPTTYACIVTGYEWLAAGEIAVQPLICESASPI